MRKSTRRIALLLTMLGILFSTTACGTHSVSTAPDQSKSYGTG